MGKPSFPVPELGPKDSVHTEVVPDTDTFRELACTRTLAEDRVLEIGCCWGQCTVILARRVTEVLGLDVSLPCVEAANELFRKEQVSAQTCIEHLDVLSHPEWLSALASRSPAFTVVFMDIGGNRCLADVLRLLQHLQNFMSHVRYIAIKSEALVECLRRAPQESSKRASWWSALIASDHSRKRRPLRPMEVIMSYPVRADPTGQEICRFANYGSCAKGDNCKYSHNFCHCCAAEGHLAHTCPLLRPFAEKMPVSVRSVLREGCPDDVSLLCIASPHEDEKAAIQKQSSDRRKLPQADKRACSQAQGCDDAMSMFIAQCITSILSSREHDREGATSLNTASVDCTELVQFQRSGGLCIDIRSPSDYQKGHIPGAKSLSLLADEERSRIYRQIKKGHCTSATELGVKVLRPRLESLATMVETHASDQGNDRRVLIYCVQGGAISEAVVSFLQRRADLKFVLLRGGYLSFQSMITNMYNDCTSSAQDPSGVHQKLPPIAILGGRTGSGKTRILHALRTRLGQQVLDLEGLAHHSGSTFGFVNQKPQPTNEQFQNDVAMQWMSFDPESWVFIEDEGPQIGKVSTPAGLYQRMRKAPVVLRLVVPEPVRIGILFEDYAEEHARKNTENWQDRMEDAIAKMGKRLGPEQTASLVRLLRQGEYREFAKFMLVQYYDKLYDQHVLNATGTGEGSGSRSGTILEVVVDESCTSLDAAVVAQQVLDSIQKSQPAAVPEDAM